MEHGYCNKTFNPNWTPELYFFSNQIESVEWYYCKEAKLCVDMFTRWDDVYDCVLYQSSNSFFKRCDMHPHPNCTNGEDERDCYEEYIERKFVSQSGIFTATAIGFSI